MITRDITIAIFKTNNTEFKHSQKNLVLKSNLTLKYDCKDKKGNTYNCEMQEIYFY
jgi:hypothetical protein